jgi:hypothetical protein
MLRRYSFGSSRIMATRKIPQRTAVFANTSPKSPVGDVDGLGLRNALWSADEKGIFVDKITIAMPTGPVAN